MTTSRRGRRLVPVHDDDPPGKPPGHGRESAERPSQTCTVTKGEGTAAGVDVVVNVDCVTATYPVGGTVVGLAAGKEVKLQNNAGNDITVTGDGPFTFPRSAAATRSTSRS